MADSVTLADKWSTASSRYQERIGRTTIHGTSRIVKLVSTYAPLDSSSYCLDVGTGGGSIPIEVSKRAPVRFLATDISPGMLEQVELLHLANTSTQVEDATALTLADNTFSHVFTSFAIQFTPSASKAVKELYRVLKPGGMAGIAIWGEYAGPLDLHERACREVKPDYQPASPNANGAWESKVEHRAQMESAGLKNVQVEVCLMPFYCTSGENFCEYWFGYNNPVPGKLLAAAEQQGIDLVELRRVMTRIADEEFDGGRQIFFTAVLGWGSKLIVAATERKRHGAVW